MRHFGIIGKPLGHSYSESYFTEKFVREHIDATYHAFAIDHIEHVQPLMKELEGFNVTYPYKETILPYLQDIDPVAKAIGAVNVVHNGIGFNTDWIGFRDSLRAWIGSAEVRALLLGTGGVSKAIQYALDEMGIMWTAVSRTAKGESGKVIGYEEVDEEVMRTHRLVVNCTPLGMHPYEHEKPHLPYHLLSKGHWMYDGIYNPEKTLFLQQGVVQGCKIKNGLEMLHLQAEQAWQIWNSI